jgi:hypothetical protein
MRNIDIDEAVNEEPHRVANDDDPSTTATHPQSKTCYNTIKQ